jgi:hypothetical protein
VDLEDLLAPVHVGRRDEDLAVEAPRAQQRRVELLEQVRGGHDDDAVGAVEAVHLDQQLVERLLTLAGDVRAALAPDGVELVDEDDRGGMLAGLAEQAADAGGAKAGEHLDERGRRLREELRAGLLGDGLGEQRLAGAGRPVQEDALGDLRAEPLEPLLVAQELHDLLKLVLGLVDAGDVVPADLQVGLRLDLDRLGLRHHLQGAPEDEDDRRHEEDREHGRPLGEEVLDALGHRWTGRDRREDRLVQLL